MSGPITFEDYTVAVQPDNLTMFGLDSDGDYAKYIIQDSRSRVTDGRFWEDSDGAHIDGTVQDPDLKSRVLLMFLLGAMVSRFQKVWGDQYISTSVYFDSHGTITCNTRTNVYGAVLE